MGLPDRKLIRFRASWGDSSGAQFAQLEAVLAGAPIPARAWRRGDVAELDLRAARRPAGAPQLALLTRAFRSAPIGAKTRILRVRLPARGLLFGDNSCCGASTVRWEFAFRSAPEVGAADRSDIRLISPGDLGGAAFEELFCGIFEPSDLGMVRCQETRRLARDLFRGRPVEGAEGYEGFVVMGPVGAAGTFFVRRVEEAAYLGFAGLLPKHRRTATAAGAVRAAAELLIGKGLWPLLFEVDGRNRRSLLMARRRCGEPESAVLIFRGYSDEEPSSAAPRGICATGA